MAKQPIIRHAVPRDFLQVWGVYLMAGEELGHGNQEKAMTHVSKELTEFFVAEVDGHILSQRQISYRHPIRYAGDDGKVVTMFAPWMHNAYTLPEYRRQGLSSRIFEAIKEEANTLGHRMLYVAAEGINTPSWWEHKGAERVGECRSCGAWPMQCNQVPMYRVNVR